MAPRDPIKNNEELFPSLLEPSADSPPDEWVADIAVPVPVERLYTYRVPDDLYGRVETGSRVMVQFSGQRLIGLVMTVRKRLNTDVRKMSPITALVDNKPVLSQELLLFIRELASYYLAPIGEVIQLAMPAVERKAMKKLREAGAVPSKAKVAPSRMIKWVRVKEGVSALPEHSRFRDAAKSLFAYVLAHGEVAIPTLLDEWPNAPAVLRKLESKGLVDIEERLAEAKLFEEKEARDVPPELTIEQQHAVSQIRAAIERTSAKEERTSAQSFLLHGVTGSGKTEVYLRAIEATLLIGKGALLLLPEIALTPQLVARFRARFGDGVAVIHSGLDASERHLMWTRLHAGEVRVAIGARSALFAPVPNLGLILVDEEHDASFKQEEGVRYHARDSAILRAYRARAVCVLGSATPSLEMLDLAQRGKLTKLTLTQRAKQQPLPQVTIIDLRKEGPGPTGSKLISWPLHEAIKKTLSAGEQAILFLNRRGFAPSVRCDTCGKLRQCPDCDVALTYHIKPGTRAKRGGLVEPVPSGLRCHYCDRIEGLPTRCPTCGGNLALEGIGTERLEETLAHAFPSARIARLDRDVASGKDAETILRRMRERDIDVLVGTQMVAKGHDLPYVTLVGVVNADAALSLPDFRASERTFQLLVQVAGRAGRGDIPGQVIIQTRTPDHPAIRYASNHDVPAFNEQELQEREELSYPPFSRLILIRLDGKNELHTLEAARKLADVAIEESETHGGQVIVRGPTPAPIARMRERFRYRVLLKGARTELRPVALKVKQLIAEMPHDIRCILDVDPMSMF